MKFKPFRFLNLMAICFLVCTSAFSQTKHFMYVETQTGQPFFARIKEKVYSSSASGYLIVPQLSEESYLVTIGFPKNILPAHKYRLQVTDKDLSYRIDIKDSSSWDLYDAVSLYVIDPSEIVKPLNSNAVATNDEFTNVLAQVSNTPSVRNITPEPEPDTAAVVAVVASKEKAPVKPAEIIKENTSLQINQVLSTLDSTGRSMIYSVKNGTKFDTVVVFIAYEAKEESDSKATAKSKRKNKKENTDLPADDITKANDTKLPETSAVAVIPADTKINQPAVDDKVVATNKEAEETKPRPCEVKADDKDFISLRRKMVDENEEQKMVEVAEKSFKSKCFDTEQIKNLCFVILDEDVRVMFLETAYPHVTDKNNFGSLVSILNKPSNISRFNKLIGL